MDKEVDQERDKRLNEAYDDNIVFGDEQVVFDVGHMATSQITTSSPM